MIGYSSQSLCNSDASGIYWIGNDNHFRQINGKDTRLLDADISSKGNRCYSFDR
jgi:hypothetical protein